MKYSEHQDKMNEIQAQISKLENELYDLAKKYVLENQESILNQWWEFYPVETKTERTFFRPTKIDQYEFINHDPDITGTFVEVNSHSVRVLQNVLHGLIVDGFLFGPSSSWEPVEAEVVQNCVDNFQEEIEIT